MITFYREFIVNRRKYDVKIAYTKPLKNRRVLVTNTKRTYNILLPRTLQRFDNIYVMRIVKLGLGEKKYAPHGYRNKLQSMRAPVNQNLYM